MKSFLTFIVASSLVFSLSAQQTATISLTSFNAVAREKQVVLSWNPEVAGIQTYELQKSKNGVDFVAFGNMQGGTIDLEYLETDFNPFDGLSYYRLKLITEDGNATFSNIVPVKYDTDGNPVSPVPVAQTEISKDSAILVIVRSAAGDEYYSKVKVTSAGDPVECFNADPNLSHGTYTIVGCSEQELYAKQLVIQ